MPDANDMPPVRVLVLHGPNLNLLGLREPGVYGSTTLEQVNQQIRDHAATMHVTVVDCIQSNHEGVLIDAVHAARDTADAIVINPGAYTHYSHALGDAVKAVIDRVITVEVHMSNVHAREEFRRHSVIAPAAAGQIAGFGVDSYLLGVTAAANLVRKKNAKP